MVVDMFILGMLAVILAYFIYDKIVPRIKKRKAKKPNKIAADQRQQEEDNLANYTADKYPRK